MSSTNSIYFNYPTPNLLDQKNKSRLVAGLLLAVVLALHIFLALYLLKSPKTEPAKPVVIMEVALLPAPKPMLKQAAKEPPPTKKEPIKPKAAVKPLQPIKKPVVAKKPPPAPKTQPTEIKDIIPVPKFEPTPPVTSAKPASPVVAPAPAAAPSANSRATAKTPPAATGHERDDSKTIVSGVVPLLRVPPKYPARAASRHIEGWVKVEFTIQTDGSVDNAVVVGSEPEDIFNDAALTAISQWKFKEKMVNGVAVPQRAVQRLQFKLEN
ncbi:MAG: energy transducer TonB [Methylococcales bacterium]|nr:energy transducer TonB [Methylococcales bacterium]MDD5632186.1 energy transducer TonB [Methylococcales bacterium]